ncbi:hypothetical protein SLEP1_g27581 [Rubroshorea leprosula]|uniref:Uncharacterized protein n=1 Tax=Rubroshorea leprosula TaxID=152421 RepID=A0AAV5JWY3_9ROSI|nr:hypothetical protein SLEP1_g27581 [Rubroshorea leprosula]
MIKIKLEVKDFEEGIAWYLLFGRDLLFFFFSPTSPPSHRRTSLEKVGKA